LLTIAPVWERDCVRDNVIMSDLFYKIILLTITVVAMNLVNCAPDQIKLLLLLMAPVHILRDTPPDQSRTYDHTYDPFYHGYHTLLLFDISVRKNLGLCRGKSPVEYLEEGEIDLTSHIWDFKPVKDSYIGR